jgi:hypothetical protein
MHDTPAMLRELNVVEQRYRAGGRDIRRHKASNFG